MRYTYEMIRKVQSAYSVEFWPVIDWTMFEVQGYCGVGVYSSLLSWQVYNFVMIIKFIKTKD